MSQNDEPIETMSLGKKQQLFLRLTLDLMDFALSRGYELTYGDAFRDTRVHGKYGEKVGYGHPKSTHKLRLALDLNLFKDGVYLTKTKAHEPLGMYWESLHPLCRWGGSWGEDGNHYSMEHNGIK